ncbi:MAG: FCD domain-containing protein [Gammaproteobacteria bacterium]|uniref:Glycolate utilization operon transcriptional activator GlcC n=1 Tax=Marinobacter nitratireducens TaxID=1137280 RepID=A0A072N0S1_9GAMM|nr:FCD domain-containing protein [Marinobacter nitratireducens]KEF30548.1 Glycolate utilization operon transcriptional activator GlcC [Marinobacter nitratireducens]TNE75861.1 MAG: FCD domain-containing protein [Gammaproteobacteria bacterium]TNE99091.1 MAG: FCD domain-containing protein [Gammaproteobacteria bacterium]
MAISQEISYRLERLILDGGLAPEQKIPSERQLAARLGVSRAVIREALHELQGRGVIETRHGKGSFVASMVPQPDNTSDHSPLMHLFEGHPRTLYDLLEVREQLEGQAAFLAAQRATSLDRHRITKAFKALEDTDPLSNARPDHGFHLAIVEASHNPVLVHVLNSLKNMMLMTVQASVANLNPREEMRKKIVRQHRQLYDAVMEGKPAIAQKVATAHVRFVSEAMRDMEKQGSKVIRMPVPGEIPARDSLQNPH